MLPITILLALGLAAASCQNPKTTAQAIFSQDGKHKPTVALVPVFDNTTPDVSWSLSDEFTHTIADKLLKKDKLFLTPLQKVNGLITDVQRGQNPFAYDIAWVKPAFAGQDYVVFMELIEHEEKPIKNSPQDDPLTCAANLDIAVRVRVLDLTKEAPSIALQEIIHHHQYMPRQFTKYNFHQEAWGHTGFAISPLGLAHAQLTKELASRIEEYILLTL